MIVQFTLRLLRKDLPSLSETDASHTLCRAFIFVCRQIYNTFEGLQVLRPYGLHKTLAAEWKKVPTPHFCMLHTHTRKKTSANHAIIFQLILLASFFSLSLFYARHLCQKLTSVRHRGITLQSFHGVFLVPLPNLC